MAPTIKERLRSAKRREHLESVLSRLEHAANKRKKMETSGTEEEDIEEEASPRHVKGRAYRAAKEGKRSRKSTGKKKAEENATSGRLTETAKKLLNCPPSEATKESHQWQGLFIATRIGEMPANNKLDAKQELKLDKTVVTKALIFGRMFKHVFPVSELELQMYGEDNDRTRVSGIVAGLTALAGNEGKVIVQYRPVRYYVWTDGVEVPVKMGALEDCASKTWKMDFVMLAMNGQKVWVPRVMVETKRDTASVRDLYQASSSGFKLQLNRLQDGLDIDRLYLEVWGRDTYVYGIQDIFGYISVRNGRVTKESFERYEAAVNKRKGEDFPMDSLSCFPKTIEDFQAAYDQKAREFSRKYDSDLPSLHGQEDFPVGVVYLSKDVRLMPTGQLEAHMTFEEECAFVQAHVRILGSNAAIEGDDCNARLLRNYKAFTEQETVSSMTEELPEKSLRVVEKPMALVEPFDPSDHGQGGSVSSFALGTVGKSALEGRSSAVEDL